jgi:RNA polymerase sigma-70 factor (ECF subfamily)
VSNLIRPEPLSGLGPIEQYVDDPTDLNALMARLADGDRAAFTAVFRTLWSPILRLCSGMLKNEADAKDAAQQAMEKILSRASDYDRARPALPWALALGAWECRTILRSRLRRREVGDQAAYEQTTAAAADDVIQQNLIEAALGAMGRLSDSDKETLLATFWEEGASVKGPTLRKRRERALERLRSTFRRIYGLD